MPLLNFTGLDFEQIKTTLKDYLKSNSDFTDYDFEGSNLSTILNVLAYNTYITSYNANMVSNEVFIDSATLRENVVSLARNIGYLPRSKKAAQATVNFFCDISSVSPTPPSVILKKGAVVGSSKQFNGQSFVFGITEDISVSVVDGIANFKNVDVYEGTVVEQSFIYSSRNPFNKFILSNDGVDLDTLKVSVKPSPQSSVSLTYARQDDLFDSDSGSAITGSSPVYFIQEVEDEQYEIIFGDGIFGKALQDGNEINVSYIKTNGEGANGISNFAFSGKLVYTRNNSTVNVTSGISLVSASESSKGGQVIESTESVKKYAPQVYATQNRALTANDYEILIPNKIYPEAESISVYGGEELVPPQYGKVFISIKPKTGDFVSNAIKENIKRDLKKYSVAGIVPEILDLKYLYIEIHSSVYYNTNLAPSAEDVGSIVSNNAQKYADSSELNKYGARFKYSKFLKIIDDSSDAITSNITTVYMRRDLRVALNSFAEYAIGFGNAFHVKRASGYNIKSTSFKINGLSQAVYLSDLPNSDLRTGTLFFFTLPSVNSQTPTIIKRNVGTIDYTTGIVIINPVNITDGKQKDGQTIIEISTCPLSNDVIGLQDLYLQLDVTHSTFNMVVDEISSGLDPSASNYIVTSSYDSGNLVRSGGPVGGNIDSGATGTTSNTGGTTMGNTGSTVTSTGY